MADLGGSRGLGGLELGAGASEVGGRGLGVLGAVVLDGGLDGILSKHAAVQLDRGQALWVKGDTVSSECTGAWKHGTENRSRL